MKSGNIFENLLKDYNVCFLSLMFKRIFEKEKFNSTYDVIGDFDFVLKTSKITIFLIVRNQVEFIIFFHQIIVIHMRICMLKS